jgi:acyl dehydratase
MMFEDLSIGQGDRLGDHLFTTEDILRFAQAYDPQPFHVDEEAARRSHFGGLIASGWHVAAVWMKLTVAYQVRQAERILSEGGRPGRLGPSPGFRNMVWKRPVRPGDRLSYRYEIANLRESASRPGWGIVEMRNGADDQSGAEVFAFDGTVFWEKRASPQDVGLA